MDNRSTRRKKAGTFSIEVIAEKRALQELSELRSGRGGRVSKYEPLIKAIQKLSGDNVIKVKLKRNEVAGLRSYLRQRLGDGFVVKTSKTTGDDFMAFIFLMPEA